LRVLCEFFQKEPTGYFLNVIGGYFVKELSASGSSSDRAHLGSNCERTHQLFWRCGWRALGWVLFKSTHHGAQWVFDGRIGGYFLKVLPMVPGGYWGGRIDSELTMNSQCTHWVNAPSPPVEVNLSSDKKKKSLDLNTSWESSS
jgi:hypothetical protein